MAYDYIVDPRNNRPVPIASERGIRILMSYIKHQNALKSEAYQHADRSDRSNKYH